MTYLRTKLRLGAPSSLYLVALVAALAAGCVSDDGTCESTRECGAGDSCVDGECWPLCSSDGHCAAGERCVNDRCLVQLEADECRTVCPSERPLCYADGQCCTFLGDSTSCSTGCDTPECLACADGSCCGDGVCQFLANEDFDSCPADCPATCEAGTCEEGQHCVHIAGSEDPVCQPGCSQRVECLRPYQCYNGECVPTGADAGCQAPCATGEHCLDDGVTCCSPGGLITPGMCHVPCVRSSDCAALGADFQCIGNPMAVGGTGECLTAACADTTYGRCFASTETCEMGVCQ